MFVDYNEPIIEPTYSSYLELDLRDVEPCISGPKRPHDRVILKEYRQTGMHVCKIKLASRVMLSQKICRIELLSLIFMGKLQSLNMGLLS